MSVVKHHTPSLPPKSSIKTSQTTLLTLLGYVFHPSIDTLTLPSLPLHIRLRLLLLQPLLLLTYTLNHVLCHLIPPLAARPKTIHIPVRHGRLLRALVYIPHPQTSSPNDQHDTRERKYPVHIDFHSGAFIGGHPEANARFCRYLAANGVLAISSSYRVAPRTMFPGAVEDVRDVIRWVVGGGIGDTIFGVDVDLERITVGGASAGGNLALAGCLLETEDRHGSMEESGRGDEEKEWTEIASKIKGIVTFYAAVSDQLFRLLFPSLFNFSVQILISELYLPIDIARLNQAVAPYHISFSPLTSIPRTDRPPHPASSETATTNVPAI